MFAHRGKWATKGVNTGRAFGGGKGSWEIRGTPRIHVQLRKGKRELTNVC